MTIESLLKPEARARATHPEGFRFCATHDCPVAYYRPADGLTLAATEVRVPIFQKSAVPDRLVCYCFQHSVREIEEQVRATGASTVPATIKAKCAEGLDDCERNNPQGSCCLGNVQRVRKAALAQNDSPDGGAPTPAGCRWCWWPLESRPRAIAPCLPLRLPTMIDPMKSAFIKGSIALLGLCLLLRPGAVPAQSPDTNQVVLRARDIFSRVAEHEFNPVRDGFTFDRQLNKHGVASLSDKDWLVRTLAVRDLVRLGTPAAPALASALNDTNRQVRQVATMVLGILQATNAVPALEKLLGLDPEPVVRSQAAVALGQIGQSSSVAALKAAQTSDKARDAQHQAELAVYAVEHGIRPTPELAASYASLDERRFGRVQVGQSASDFQLPDTEGKAWRLSEFRGKKPVVLIWIFADWCPVCHGEFRELIELRNEFEAAGVQVFTLECHDRFPCRVMVGKELDPKYWFSKTSFKEAYTQKIWWPHLADRAGAVGAEYGVQPMAFAVHSEYINRPSVVIVDKAGTVCFAYYGTFWGDRPSIHRTLDMVRTGDYSFDAPKRLKAVSKP